MNSTTDPPDADDPPPEGPDRRAFEGPRYQDLGLLGEGGMGVVRRVEDRLLRRTVAMKVARVELSMNPEGAALFLAEARVHAGLVHPNIVPVFDLGTLPDGRVYFTMQEVRGRTLRDAIRSVHAASADGWAEDAGGWTLRRLVDALARASEGVAFAHAAGVVHRDLKPGNLMLGDFGEVLVMDWGLARASQIRPGPETRREEEAATRLGAVTGTPAYMAPEQARGERLDARADVYALGATLYEILAGKTPYEGSGREVLAQLCAGPPRLVSEVARNPVPSELAELCAAAMAWDRADRLPDAAAVVAGLRSWLDGLRRAAEAQALVAEADLLQAKVAALRATATAQTASATQALRTLDLWAPEADKAPLWAALDVAADRTREADLLEVDWLGRLQGALERVPELPEALTRLADAHHDAHATAEARGDVASARRSEALLRAADRGRYARYLRGEGTLTLRSDPPAEVLASPYVERGRRLVAESPVLLGTTPLREHPLAAGSYLLILRAPGHDDLRLPTRIGRDEHGVDLPPGASDPVLHRLAPIGALQAEDVLVPAGWFLAGDDALVPRAWPAARQWTEAFVLRRDPVTVAEWLEFLNKFDFSSAGFPADTALVKRIDGRYQLADQGDPRPDWPAMLLSWHLATAFAAWRAELDGLPWQLPWERWWEKAARGVDGRAFPMGLHLDPTWAATRDSGPVALGPSPVGEHPDFSPYGVRGLAGNVRCWCADLTPQGTHPARGGAWNYPTDNCKSALRTTHTPDTVASNLGLRLARPWG